MNSLICIAHRGASGHEPENTMLEVEKALSLGARAVEIDVWPVEEQLVVIHDRRLERTTDGTGEVMGRSLAYLRSLNAGKAQHIPLLTEVLDLIAGKASVNVELKDRTGWQSTACAIEKYVAQGRLAYNQVLLSSFDHDALRAVRAACPAIPVGMLVGRADRFFLKSAFEMGACSINISFTRVSRRMVDGTHRLNMKLFAYTVNTSDDLNRMAELGVDGVFSDFPEIVLSAFPAAGPPCFAR